MNFFDMKTIFFSYAVSNAICTGFITRLWLQNRRRFAGLDLWLACFAAHTVYILLVMLRGIVPDWISVVASNVVLVGGTLLLYIGLERFVNQRGTQIHNYAMLAIFAAVQAYFAFVRPNLAAREINISAGLSVICFQGMWLMLRRVSADMYPITKGVGLTLIVYGLVSVTRIIAVAVAPPGYDFFKESGPFDTLLILTYQMLFIVLTFSLSLMINHRLLTDMEHDIVRRQQMETALRSSEEKFAKAFQASPDAILITRLNNGQFIEVNEGFCRLSEYSHEEARTNSSIALGLWANPQDREQCISALQENHSVRDFEYNFRTKSGRILKCLYSGEIIDLGGEAHIMSVVRDITERKQAEEKLRASEARYDELVQRIPVGVYVLHADTDGSMCFEYTSPQFDRLLGLEAEAVLRDANLAFEAAHPLDRADLIRANRQAIMTLTPFHWEGRFIIRDETRWMRIETTPTRLPDGDSVWNGVVSDITERKQAETALQGEKEFVERALNAQLDTFFVFDPQTGKAQRWNQAFKDISGYSDEEIAQLKAPDAYYAPSDLERAAQETQLIFERGAGTIELEFICKDGRKVPFEYIASVMYNTAGEPSFISIGRNVAGRKRTEEIIRLRLRLFEFAANHSLDELMQKALDEIGEITNSPIGFYHFVEADQKTLLLQAWSTRTLQEFCRAEGQNLHYGIDQAGVWVDCVHQRKPIIHNDYAALPHRKGMPPGHAEVKRELVVPTMREGRVVSILGVGNKPSEYNEQDVELVAYVADITWSIVERKRAEAQLQDYQRQLEAQNLELRKLSLAIEQSGNTIVITDTAGTIQYANPRFEETTGYTLPEALGQNPRILKSGEQSAGFYQNLWQTITSGQIWRGEFQNRRKDGALYWESATIAPVHNDAGHITHYIAIKDDITARKQAETARQQAKEAAEAANRAKSAFLANMSHELRTPLNAVLGFSELMANDPNLTPQQKENLDIIGRSGEHLLALINTVLNLSKIEAGHTELQPEVFDLHEMLLGIGEMFSLQARKKGLTVVFDFAPDTPHYIRADAGKLRQVLINLLNNAVKFTSHGGIIVRVTATDKVTI